MTRSYSPFNKVNDMQLNVSLMKESMLNAVFRQGLNGDALTTITCCDSKATSDSLIYLAIRLNNFHQDRKPK